MGVFPAASSSHVPKPWATLMSDPVSKSFFNNNCRTEFSTIRRCIFRIQFSTTGHFYFSPISVSFIFTEEQLIEF